MSPINKKKLNIIRSKLDKLDNKLLSLIKNRTNLVKEVLKLKEFKKEIVDKKRIKKLMDTFQNFNEGPTRKVIGDSSLNQKWEWIENEEE